MKIIFLDIDGVLNSETSCMESMKHELDDVDKIGRDMPHIMHIKHLNEIITQTGAKVVITSTWRGSFGSYAFQRLLWLCGFKGEVIGKTPHLNAFRGTEIKCWMMEHKSRIVQQKDYGTFMNPEPIESFVILDDDSDMEDLSEFLVKTDSYKGLLEEHVQQCVNILNKKEKIK